MAVQRVLQIGRLLPQLEAALEREFSVVRLADQPDAAAFLAKEGASFDAVATSAAVGVDAGTLAALPNLKVVSSFGVGLDQIDLPAMAARGIVVGHTPDVLNDCVADTAFALLLDAARGISASDRFVRAGSWLKARFPLQTKVSGKKLGILGLGRIGRTIARRASGFDMEIRYTNRRPVDGVPYTHEPDLKALAAWADFLVIAAAGGADSRGMVSAEVLDALGPQGFLVNIARGTVVDEAALVQALKDKRIAGAGLDVFEDEPNVPPALFTLDNVVLLPHVASGTHETRQAMADLTLENLRRFHAGQPLAAQAPAA
jgi:lactate dehydrogenase-like 2-hydroxyacid dehydrogenase